MLRGIVKRNPKLKLKLKKANSKLSPLQYVHQSIMMTIGSVIALIVIMYPFTKSNPTYMIFGALGMILFSPVVYKFWFSYVDVLIQKYGRELEGDLLFVSEYLLVSLESGLPIGNSIENLSKIDRPGGKFFKRIYTEFKTGKSFEDAFDEGSRFAPVESAKNLIKRLKDSLEIGVDLKGVLVSFIEESSEKKLMEVKSFSKKLNPIIMMYLLLGIVLPSLGVTFLILGITMLDSAPELLRIILIFIFLLMFAFQYLSYTSFKFSRSTI
jgi:flagellar protein FlaJ